MKYALNVGYKISDRYTVKKVVSLHAENQIVYLCKDEEKGKKLLINEFYPEAGASRLDDGSIEYNGSIDAALEKYNKEHDIRATFRDFPTVISSGATITCNNTFYTLCSYYEGKTVAEITEESSLSLSLNSVRRALMTVIDMERALLRVNLCQKRLMPENILIDSMGHLRLLEFHPEGGVDENKLACDISALGVYMLTGSYPSSGSGSSSVSSKNGKILKELMKIVKLRGAGVTLNDLYNLVSFEGGGKLSSGGKKSNLKGILIACVALFVFGASALVTYPVYKRLQNIGENATQTATNAEGEKMPFVDMLKEDVGENVTVAEAEAALEKLATPYIVVDNGDKVKIVAKDIVFEITGYKEGGEKDKITGYDDSDLFKDMDKPLVKVTVSLGEKLSDFKGRDVSELEEFSAGRFEIVRDTATEPTTESDKVGKIASVTAEDADTGIIPAKGKITCKVYEAMPTVPDVKGKKRNEAKNLIEEEELIFEEKIEKTTDQSLDGSVKSQKPGKGERKNKGTKVTCVIYKYEAATNKSNGKKTSDQSITNSKDTVSTGVEETKSLDNNQTVDQANSNLNDNQIVDQTNSDSGKNNSGSDGKIENGKNSKDDEKTDTYVVPYVIDMDETHARNELEANGFRVTIIEKEGPKGSVGGLVYDYQPRSVSIEDADIYVYIHPDTKSKN